MSAHPTNTERGFTLMELCIGLTLLSIALLAVGASVMSGRQTYDQGMAAGEVEVQVRRTIDRIVAELSAAGRASLTPGSSEVMLRCHAPATPVKSTGWTAAVQPQPLAWSAERPMKSR